MIERPELVTELHRFSRALVTDYPSSDTLHDLVETAVTILQIHAAGTALVRDERLRFATASTEDVTTLELVQERDQEGPCVLAYRTMSPVLVTDLAHDRRWPALGDAAAATPVVSVAAVPLQVDGVCLGALDLYDVRPHAWDADEIQAAELLAALATSHLAAASRLERERLTAQQLQEALDSRVIIEQAKGLLAGERGISLDQAFRVLRAHARSNSVPLREVAHAIVDLGLRP